MEKLKNFVVNFGQEIIYLLFFALFFIFGLIGLFQVEINEVAYQLNLYFLIGGGYIGEIYFSSNLVLILVAASVSISFILYVFCRLFKQNNDISKVLNSTSLVINALSFILLSLSSIIQNQNLPAELIELETEVEFNDIGIILLLFTIAVLCLVNLRNFFGNVKYKTSEIVEIAMLVSLAIVLDKFASIDVGATGGSFNFSGIPLLIICLRHGPLKGLISSSIIFGLITCLIDGYGLQTYPFDYLIAFSGYALCGIVFRALKNYYVKDSKSAITTIIISSLCGAIGVFITRMIGSSISSIYFYNYTLEAALLYNVLYVGPSAAICFVSVCLLAYPIYRINNFFPVK